MKYSPPLHVSESTSSFNSYLIQLRSQGPLSKERESTLGTKFHMIV